MPRPYPPQGAIFQPRAGHRNQFGRPHDQTVIGEAGRTGLNLGRGGGVVEDRLPGPGQEAGQVVKAGFRVLFPQFQ